MAHECIEAVRKARAQHNCWVYLIGFIQPDGTRHGPVKIGIAADLDRRISQLQTGSPYTLELFKCLPFGCREHAKEMERGLHKLFERQRTQGEWFDLDGDDVDTQEDTVRELYINSQKGRNCGQA